MADLLGPSSHCILLSVAIPSAFRSVLEVVGTGLPLVWSSEQLNLRADHTRCFKPCATCNTTLLVFSPAGGGGKRGRSNRDQYSRRAPKSAPCDDLRQHGPSGTAAGPAERWSDECAAMCLATYMCPSCAQVVAMPSCTARNWPSADVMVMMVGWRRSAPAAPGRPVSSPCAPRGRSNRT